MKIFNLLKPALIGAAILLPIISEGQSLDNIPPSYLRPKLYNVPLGVLPMQYNSSFAGESDGARFNAAFSYHLTSDRSPFTQKKLMESQSFGYHASYDQFIPALRSGIAVSVNRASISYLSPDLQVSGQHGIGASTGGGPNPPGHIDELRTYHNNISLAIAPKFSLKGKYTISPSIDFSYGQGQTTANFIKEKLEAFDPNSNHQMMSSRLGLLFNTHNYYIGYSAYLVNRYYHDHDGLPEFHYPFFSYLQAGYTFQRSPESKFSFTPQIAISVRPEERGFNNIFRPRALNLSFRYDQFIAGLNNTGLHLGWQAEKFRVMVSNWPWSGEGVPFYRNGNIALRGCLSFGGIE